MVSDLAWRVMAGPAGLDRLVAGALDRPARIAEHRRNYSRHLLEIRLGAPEATAGEHRARRLAGRRNGRALRRSALHLGLIIGRAGGDEKGAGHGRSEEHTSELQSLMRISYAVFCLKKKKKINNSPKKNKQHRNNKSS